ncbi:MAG TPA: DUF3306 domain-containing protein, partial [Azospirillaceae bacterium]|nr:DUF3306 domain-containing protein [Azospirillaceae bacterium]
MADRESFFSRWSRLKREEKPAEETPAPVEEEEAVVDPETLPPIDTLGADSDYRQFLMRGVPAELKRLALRKAWASDPVIANFRGLAEYDWDFNAPGYGQLLPA